MELQCLHEEKFNVGDIVETPTGECFKVTAVQGNTLTVVRGSPYNRSARIMKDLLYPGETHGQ